MNAGRTGSSETVYFEFTDLRCHNPTIPQGRLPVSGPNSEVELADADFRGRDASYLAPPAQIRTGPIRAYGSHLGCLTAKRLAGHG